MRVALMQEQRLAAIHHDLQLTLESTPLRVEKVLSPGVTTFVVIHPLKPGEYPFFDEFNPQLPEGSLLAQ